MKFVLSIRSRNKHSNCYYAVFNFSLLNLLEPCEMYGKSYRRFSGKT